LLAASRRAFCVLIPLLDQTPTKTTKRNSLTDNCATEIPRPLVAANGHSSSYLSLLATVVRRPRHDKYLWLLELCAIGKSALGALFRKLKSLKHLTRISSKKNDSQSVTFFSKLKPTPLLKSFSTSTYNRCSQHKMTGGPPPPVYGIRTLAN
jgi:hypothetical protein